MCCILLFSGEWRYLVPTQSSFKEAWQVLLFDLKISNVHPPKRKFNAAQQIVYTSVVLMEIGSVLTGIAIYKPFNLPGFVSCWTGTALPAFSIW